MSSQLVHVQNAFKDDNNVLILSHTVNPSNDSVEVLNGYAQTYGAIKNKWHLLTGNKKSNQLLSEKRAYEVYSYLLKCNLDAKRLFWKGRSDSAAFGNIKTENKQLDRRVNLKFVDCSVK